MRTILAFGRRALAVALAGALPVMAADLTHRAGADPCAPVLVAHDASAHRIVSQPAARSDHDHCYICHWGRTARALMATGERVADPGEIGSTVRLAAVAPAHDFVLAALPPRAPPL